MTLQDLFTTASLTDAINRLPPVPTKVGASGLFEDKGIKDTTVVIDERDGRLVLVPNISRNADPEPAGKNSRTRRTFQTLHLPLSGNVQPVDLQSIASFGSENPVEAQAAVINDELERLKNSIDATREFQRVGALRGKILDADGSTVLDLFDEFGVAKKSITVALANEATDVRKACLDAKRYSEKKVGATLVTGFRAYCGPAWFDALTSHKNVKAAFEGWQAAQDRLGGDQRSGFTFGGIEFIEYDVTVGNQRFIPEDVAQLFPVARGLYKMYNAPANYNEAVNTLGKAFYAKAEERRLGKGWELEAQANPLALCLAPGALIELKVG
ncbi:major capsid protein [Lysobacter sp. CA196]|uniref:major capsid protein n=1 Tax=Lysobacter sp. CA196 TaxID=3455606 RepID=UPI003F8D50A0